MIPEIRYEVPMEFVNSHPMACTWAGRALSALVTPTLVADAANERAGLRSRREAGRIG
jgi:hypothetical protein